MQFNFNINPNQNTFTKVLGFDYICVNGFSRIPTPVERHLCICTYP